MLFIENSSVWETFGLDTLSDRCVVKHATQHGTFCLQRTYGARVMTCSLLDLYSFLWNIFVLFWETYIFASDVYEYHIQFIYISMCRNESTHVIIYIYVYIHIYIYIHTSAVRVCSRTYFFLCANLVWGLAKFKCSSSHRP